ncbi:MAG: NAD-dependent protein deacylase [Arenicellales bacterium]|nr:NAD-dependent protein deacylase [Arenicellales bacterium]
MREIESIVVLTGAGISAESGLPTFRGAGGVWEHYRVEDVASPQAFARDPQLVHRFYNSRRQKLLSANIKPNSAHLALAAFESAFDGEFLVVTQNIDNLHEQAGSENIVHMHGELLKKRCQQCLQVTFVYEDINTSDGCERCGKQGTLRPHVVWFGEMPLEMDHIHQALEKCDLFISVGTSGNVYPAAGFVDIANMWNSHSVEINLEPSAIESSFKEKIYGPAASMLPKFLTQLQTKTTVG